ncbi:hypothetical protein PV773_17735 [Mesorhizobium sp. CC13]|uniref:hypothetical protein n=1 Tax=Mesorhizobium sp. CC13 TaxID=3029194 RepID=UPI0032632DD6
MSKATIPERGENSDGICLEITESITILAHAFVFECQRHQPAARPGTGIDVYCRYTGRADPRKITNRPASLRDISWLDPVQVHVIDQLQA